jgi:hypothetical protein
MTASSAARSRAVFELIVVIAYRRGRFFGGGGGGGSQGSPEPAFAAAE